MLEQEINPKKILVVEDDLDDQYLINQCLADISNDITIDFINDGRSLLLYLTKQKLLPNLIILDLNMPFLNGLQALKLIKEKDEFKNIRVFIFSTSNSEKKEALALGAEQFYMKPDNLLGFKNIMSEMVAHLTTETISSQPVNLFKNATEKTIKVLIVEDDQDDIYLIKGLLKHVEKYRYEVTTASTINDLLDNIETQKFDVVLLDLNLADSEGKATLALAKTHVVDAPIIVISGESLFNDEEELIALGATDFLAKSEITGYLLAKSINFARERYKLLKKLETLALTDALTGLPNRMRFEERLTLMMGLSRRSEHKLAVAFIDIDDFKPVNDKYGHNAGDELLQIFAERLKNSLRKSDIAARIGGDEFVMLIYHYKHQKNLTAIFNGLKETLIAPYTVHKNTAEVTVTIGVSIGIQELEKNITAKDIINGADKQMYKAKENGKNQIMIGAS